MKIGALISAGSQLILGRPTTVIPGSADGAKQAKSLGEAPPVRLNPSEIGRLATYFAQGGLIDRLKKRLNLLKNKKCVVVPAKGTVACIDDKDMVYLGIEFLEKHKDDPETLAGVLAHEWGHSCALKPSHDDLQELNWDEIFEMRRSHETLADEICGRLLYLMGYSPEGVIKFLKSGKDTHNLKYHSPEIREKVIRYGYEAEKRNAGLAQSLFGDSTYKNQYHSSLLDIV